MNDIRKQILYVLLAESSSVKEHGLLQEAAPRLRKDFLKLLFDFEDDEGRIVVKDFSKGGKHVKDIINTFENNPQHLGDFDLTDSSIKNSLVRLGLFTADELDNVLARSAFTRELFYNKLSQKIYGAEYKDLGTVQKLNVRYMDEKKLANLLTAKRPVPATPSPSPTAPPSTPSSEEEISFFNPPMGEQFFIPPGAFSGISKKEFAKILQEGIKDSEEALENLYNKIFHPLNSIMDEIPEGKAKEIIKEIQVLIESGLIKQGDTKALELEIKRRLVTDKQKYKDAYSIPITAISEENAYIYNEVNFYMYNFFKKYELAAKELKISFSVILDKFINNFKLTTKIGFLYTFTYCARILGKILKFISDVFFIRTDTVIKWGSRTITFSRAQKWFWGAVISAIQFFGSALVAKLGLIAQGIAGSELDDKIIEYYGPQGRAFVNFKFILAKYLNVSEAIVTVALEVLSSPKTSELFKKFNPSLPISKQEQEESRNLGVLISATTKSIKNLTTLYADLVSNKIEKELTGADREQIINKLKVKTEEFTKKLKDLVLKKDINGITQLSKEIEIFQNEINNEIATTKIYSRRRNRQ